MRVISHRGNINGPGKDSAPADVRVALEAGYDVEVDVRMVDGSLRLGHDAPGDKVPSWMLFDAKVWFHAKDIEAASYLATRDVKVFCHDNDPFVVVDQHIWVHPNTSRKTLVLPNAILLDIAGFERLSRDVGKLAFAVCTDWPKEWK